MIIQFTEDIRWGAFHNGGDWAAGRLSNLTWSTKKEAQAWIDKQPDYSKTEYIALPLIKAKQLITAIIT